MEIVFHIGGGSTDRDRLLRSLLRDADALAARGVVVPGPGRYRKLMSEAIRAREAGDPPEVDREELLEAALDGGEARRAILTYANFLGLPPGVFGRGVFYPRAEVKAAALAAIFEGDELEMHLALRNPASFLPAVFAQAGGRGLDSWLGGADPRQVRWSEVVGALRHGAPRARLTVWCDEDTPLIWGELLAGLGGPGQAGAPKGRHDMALALMTPEGAELFARYMEEHPDQAPDQERRVISAYLERYAKPEETWEEVDLPGWDQDLIEEMTWGYEEDVARVAARDDVTFVRP